MDKKELERLEYRRQMKKKNGQDIGMEERHSYKRKKAKQIERLIRRTIFFLLIIFILLLILFLSPLFRIKNINYQNAYYMDMAKANKNMEGFLGRSIFLYNKNELESIIKKDPYVENVKVKASLNGNLDITVSEYNKDFFIETTSGYLIVNRNLKILENVTEKPKNIIEFVDGIDVGKPGDIVGFKKEKIDFINDYLNLMDTNTSTVVFEKIDITDFGNIKLFYKKIEVDLGSVENMKDKINKAINIIKKPEVSDLEAVINLKYDAAPVITPKSSQEKEKDQPDKTNP